MKVMLTSCLLADRISSVLPGLAQCSLTEADAAEACAVIRAAFAVQPRETSPPSSALRETPDSVAAKIAAGGAMGIRASGTLVAVALWQTTGEALHVARLSVLPERRGHGLARMLVAACEGIAREARLARLTLKVRLELPENQRFFESCGFRFLGDEAHPGFDAPTTGLMEKPLP
jgi:ribosomal protein S18 acetylase RimI-like enzyme